MRKDEKSKKVDLTDFRMPVLAMAFLIIINSVLQYMKGRLGFSEQTQFWLDLMGAINALIIIIISVYILWKYAKVQKAIK